MANRAPAAVRAAALAAISHGTGSLEGQQLVQALVEHTRGRAAGHAAIAETRLGHVDVQQPDVAATVDSVGPNRPVVLVPLLLSAGYHVAVDMRQAADQAPHHTVVGEALGPDHRLAMILRERLRQAGAVPGEDVIVLGAAGSSTPRAVTDVQDTAQLLASLLDVDVTDSYLAFARPTVREAVDEARRRHPKRRVVIASYLLAPGYFQKLMHQQGADLVTQPLLCTRDGVPDVPPELPEIVLDRFHDGLARL